MNEINVKNLIFPTPLDLQNIKLEYDIFGVKMQQNNYALSLINILLNYSEPDLIVEFGSRTGALSIFLANYCFYQNKKFITFENSKDSIPLKYESHIKFLNGQIEYENIFDEKSYKLIEEESKNKKTIFFCDATKIEEFNLYSTLMKVGDVILAHDYAHDEEDFDFLKQNSIWVHNEIMYKDIKECCEKNNIHYLAHDIFKLSAWGVFIKR